MGNDAGDELAKSIKDSLTFKKMRDSVSHWLGGDTPPDNAPKPDNAWYKSAVEAANESFRKPQAVQPQPDPKPVPKSVPKKPALKSVPKYEQGTDYVPKTGPAILHKGEAVLPKAEAETRRMQMNHWSGSVKGELGGEDKKPPKHISHIVHRKSHNGDHIFEHHHVHPDHHPMEVHTKRGDDEMVEHMLAHAGSPNQGEVEANAGTPEASNGMPSPSGAAVAPSGMPSPGV